MASKEQDQPKQSTGAEILKNVLLVGVAFFIGKAILGNILGNHHQG